MQGAGDDAMSTSRTCLCGHDVLWHGVGIGHNECRARELRGDADVFGWPCRCQGFRTVVPGETMPEPDLLQMLWRLDRSLGRLEALLEARLSAPPDADEGGG